MDDTLGPALVVTLPADQFAVTVDLQLQFLRSTRPGRLHSRGRVVQRGTRICFPPGDLTDPANTLTATATAHIQTTRT